MSAGPLLARLRSRGCHSPDLERRILALASQAGSLPPRTHLQSETDAVPRPRYLLAGWACRFRLLADGSRQVFDFVLPGDGVAVGLRPTPFTRASVVAITRVELVDAQTLLTPAALRSEPDFVHALQAAADVDERRMLDHIVRLGRMAALERMGHLLLQLHDRLAGVGLASGGRFPMPLTQEIMADSLGLSVVHVNRTLRELRRQGLAQLDRGEMWIVDPAALKALVDYTP